MTKSENNPAHYSSSLLRLERAFGREGLSVALSQEDPSARVFSVEDTVTGVQAQILIGTRNTFEAPQLELKAVKQLLGFASVLRPDTLEFASMACCATPDFHPGSTAPVGAIVATPDDVVMPHAIGTDINCGMRMLTTGMSWTQLLPHLAEVKRALKESLLEGRRNIPVDRKVWVELLTHNQEALFQTPLRGGLWDEVDQGRLAREVSKAIGLASLQKAKVSDLPTAYLEDKQYPIYRDPALGTIGSGNHFVEFNVVDEVLDPYVGYQFNLKPGDVVVQVHSGSRDIGFHVGQQWMDKAKHHWSQARPTLKHPESGLYALAGPLAQDYLGAMSAAARYAWFNRVVLAEMVRTVLASKSCLPRSELIVDIPHNIILQEEGFNVHRKGATPSIDGKFAIIPGSMGDYSYLVHGTSNPKWLNSCSHGAGRKVRRGETHHLKSKETSKLQFECVTLSQERLIEESPLAYKNIGPVIEAQTSQELVRPALRLRPWLTFKA